MRIRGKILSVELNREEIDTLVGARKIVGDLLEITEDVDTDDLGLEVDRSDLFFHLFDGLKDLTESLTE